MRKVHVNTSPVADHYETRPGRIVEFSHPNGGGLISFMPTEDGKVIIVVYRHDATVEVRTGQPST